MIAFTTASLEKKTLSEKEKIKVSLKKCWDYSNSDLFLLQLKYAAFSHIIALQIFCCNKKFKQIIVVAIRGLHSKKENPLLRLETVRRVYAFLEIAVPLASPARSSPPPPPSATDMSFYLGCRSLT